MSQPNRLLSVLIADDTPANQKFVGRLLGARGHRCATAANGLDALNQFRQSRFDVVLMDVHMPVMDGYAATKAIRQAERVSESHTPIVALTTHAAEGDCQRCMDAGMDAYLNKPIDAPRLIGLVESLADQTMPKTPNRPAAASPDHIGGKQSMVDFDGAMTRLGGDQSLFRDFVAVFDEDSPRLLAGLQEGVANRDGILVERAAHSLRGLTANFGARPAVDAATNVEELGKADRWEDVEGELVKLEHALAVLREELDEYRA